MTIGTIDSKSPPEVLADYRRNGHPAILEQAKKFRTLSPAHETMTLNKIRVQVETLCQTKK